MKVLTQNKIVLFNLLVVIILLYFSECHGRGSLLNVFDMNFIWAISHSLEVSLFWLVDFQTRSI